MGYKLYSRVMEDCKGAFLGAVTAIVTDSNSTLLLVQVHPIVVHLEDAPASKSCAFLGGTSQEHEGSVDTPSSCRHQEFNPMVDEHMMERCDPMILEASMPSVPPSPMRAKGCGL